MEIYKGTILDGTFVQNKNDKIFIVTDVYMFKGQDYTKSQLESKLLTIRTFLQSNYDVDDKNNSLEITVNKTYEIDQTEHVINNVVPKIKNFLIRGICFYPEISGTKLLFKFGNENTVPIEITSATFQTVNNSSYNQTNNNYNHANNKKKQVVSKDQKDDSSDSNRSSPTNIKVNNSSPTTVVPKAPEIKKVAKVVYIPKDGEDEENYVFEMQKTDKVDVYKLMALETVVKDDKKLLKRVQVCLAYVPNMTRSKWCKDTVNKTGGNVLVNCKYYPDKYKWEPISVAKAKKPSFIESFDTETME